MQESTIDYPKSDGLCQEIWQRSVSLNGVTEEWTLVPEVADTIQNVISSVFPEAETVHITGSITSNSYTKNADIDVHVLTPSKNVSEAEADEINKQIRVKYSEKKFIGTHPIEIYFQLNEFQDYMSVGCYDFLNKKWLVGPELQDQSFDPYSEYYKDIQNNAKKLLTDIRNNILEIYEKAVAASKMQADTTIKANTELELFKAIENSLKLFEQLRQSRKVYSSPKSKEEALKYRTSRKWKVADATFKLIDKFGYTQIFKQLKELTSNYDMDNVSLISDMLPTSIIAIIKDGIGNADKLAEAEKN